MKEAQLDAKSAIDFIYDKQLRKPSLKLTAKNGRDRTKAQLFFVGEQKKDLYVIVGDHVDAKSTRILIEHPLTTTLAGVRYVPDASPYQGSPVKNAAFGRKISIRNQYTVYVETTDALDRLLEWYSGNVIAVESKVRLGSNSLSADARISDTGEIGPGSDSFADGPQDVCISSNEDEAKVDTSGDSNAELKGTGYESDPAIRSVVEKHAVGTARRFYEERGYTVEEKGKPYDLFCTRPGEAIHVEVKGSRSALDAIIVTINEVNDARDPEWRSDLFLVDNIVIEPDGQNYAPSGGRSRLKRGWVPEDKDLTPTQFRYKLPPIPDAE